MLHPRFRHVAIAAVVAVGCASAPAIAGKPGKRPLAEQTIAVPADTMTPGRKFCIREEASTGSRIARQSCRTIEEWQNAGVAIVAQ